MSIKDFVQKIKRYLDIDIYTIMCLLIIVMVGISSFGLGRLSVNTNINKDLGVGAYITNRVDQDKNINNKKYVASKNGSLYYRIGCKRVNRIDRKNRIYFGNSIEAEKSGYKPSTSC